jgi:hypothetical protein
MALWLKLLKLLDFFVGFQHSHPQRRVLKGPAMYTWYLIWMSMSLQSNKCFDMPMSDQDFFILDLTLASSFNSRVMMVPKYLNSWTKCMLYGYRL